jgi:fatty-acyl-CoA synthase
LLASSEAILIAVDDEFAPMLAAMKHRHPDLVSVGLDSTCAADLAFDDLCARESPAPTAAVSESTPALTVFTSGTTGVPRGVTLTHGNLAAHVTQTRLAQGWTHRTNVLLCVPLAFTGGIVNNFLAAVGSGAMLVLERTFDPERALDLLCSTPITAMGGVPVMWQMISDAPGFGDADLRTLRSAVTGGAPVPRELLERYRAKGVVIQQAYALSEATGSVSMNPSHFALSDPDCAGIANAFTEIRIVDESGAAAQAGTVGEILVRGPQVMAGYWNDEAQTALVLRDGWLHTGDLGTITGKGLLRVVDRMHDKVISGGLNVYPAEIELVVSAFPGITEVGAFGVPDARWGEVVAICYRGDITTAQLASLCRSHLGDYKCPTYLVEYEDPLPRGMSAKVLRRALRSTFDRTRAISVRDVLGTEVAQRSRR